MLAPATVFTSFVLPSSSFPPDAWSPQISGQMWQSPPRSQALFTLNVVSSAFLGAGPDLLGSKVLRRLLEPLASLPGCLVTTLGRAGTRSSPWRTLGGPPRFAQAS